MPYMLWLGVIIYSLNQQMKPPKFLEFKFGMKILIDKEA